MPKLVTLLTGGTRGDVQPYVALGLGLREEGYRVRVAAHDGFANFVRAWDLEFISLGENPSDLFYRAEQRDALRGGNNLFHTARAAWHYWQVARPLYVQLVERAWLAAQNCDALIYGLPTFWAGALGDALHIHTIPAFMQPLTPTRAFPCPLLPISNSLGAVGNRLSYTFCFAVMRLAWREALRAWHKKFRGARVSTAKIETPTLYAYSQHIVPRPSDLPVQHHVTGFWFLPARAWTPPQSLENFLRAGAAPIFFSLGSATARDEQHLGALLLETQRATGLRFLISKFQGAHALPRTAFFALDDVPHAWLLAHVRAVIHHGGAGTTAAALRAGVPQIITPIYSDSYFWGQRVFEKGVGARPLPEAKLSARALTDALEKILHDQMMQSRARALAQEISREHGVRRALELLRELF